MQLMLLSNSRMPKGQFLEWVKEDLIAFLPPKTKHLLFFPFAGVHVSYEDYTAWVQEALPAYEVLNAATFSVDQPPASVDAIFVGGGNTFCLLHSLREKGWLRWIDQQVRDHAVPYVGWSAGSNVAAPTIKTTNDMPIVDPNGFEALNFIPFQINAHFTDQTIPNHGGETRTQRLEEFLDRNRTASVLALEEGAYLEVQGSMQKIGGLTKAYFLSHKQPTTTLNPGTTF